MAAGLVRAGETTAAADSSVAAVVCAVCGGRFRVLVGDECSSLSLCCECFERLDQLDRDHTYPAFHFASAIVANREAAHMEGVE